MPRGPPCSCSPRSTRCTRIHCASTPRGSTGWRPAASCGAPRSPPGPRRRSGTPGTARSRCFGGSGPSTCSIETGAAPGYLPPAMNVIPQRVRDGFERLLDPIATVLIRFHVRPNVITTIGTLIVVASAAAFAVGWVRWAGFLLLFSGVFDMVDGRVARRGDMTTTFGAFYDSTLDRVGEAALFSGIALYFLRGGVAADRLTLAVAACLVGLAASLLVSYTRARAEGLGLTAKVGIAQRAERVLLLGVPSMFLGAGNQGTLLFWIVVVLALATSVTVIQRIVFVARAAGGPVVRRAQQRDTLPGHAPALQSRKGQ